MMVFKLQKYLLLFMFFKATTSTFRGLNITTTAPFNEAVQKYDVWINMPFNVSCEYTNMPLQYLGADIKWFINDIIVFNVDKYQHGTKVLTEPPEDYRVSPDTSLPRPTANTNPEDILGYNGTLHMLAIRAPREFYDNSCQDVKVVCAMYTVNGYEVEDSLTYEEELNIVVVDPAKINNITKNSTVSEGDEVTLHCDTHGLPKPLVTWTRADHKHFTDRPGFQHTTEDGKLTLSDVSDETSGVYLCSATNRVTRSPVIEATTVTVLYRPIISVHTLIVYQMVHYNTELECSLKKSYPPVTNVTWYYKTGSSSSITSIYGETVNGIAISENDDRLLSTNFSDEISELRIKLHIKYVEKEDFGRQFCCVFNNDIGNSERCLLVKESNKPVTVNGKPPQKAAINSSSNLRAAIDCVMASVILILLYAVGI